MKQSFLFSLLFALFSVGSEAQNHTAIHTENTSAIKATLGNALASGGAAGTEFYITFPPRYKPANGSPTYKLYISSSARTKVRLEVEGKGVLTEKMTVANDVVDFTLAAGTAEMYNRTPSDIIASEQVFSQAAIHITAGAPIVMYAFSLYEDGGGDSFLALPVNVLGKEYIVSSMPDMGWQSGGVSFPSEVCVVAPYDNTPVTITIGGNTSTQTVSGLTPGKSKTFSMNRGDVLLVSTSRNSHGGDLSGTRVVSTKPLAVVSGHQCANVPSDKGRCGYLAEMEIPTNMWGKTFLIPRHTLRSAATMIKVVAKESNTQIYKNGTVWRTLKTAGGVEGTGFVYERIDSAANSIAVVSADKPISVTLFNPGKEDDNYTTMPFQMLILPIEQYQTHYTFHTPGVNGNKSVAQNYCSIVYPLTANNTIPDSLEFGAAENGTYQWRKLSAVFSSATGDVYPVQIKGISYAAKMCTLPANKAFSIRSVSNQPFMCYSYGFSDSLAYAHPIGAALTLVSNDAVAPNPKWEVNCDGSVEGATVTDLPNEANTRSNLSTIVLDPTLSKNYFLEYDAFIPGDAISTKWRLRVIDLDQDALAVITFSDRAGNDTTIRVSYAARNITIEHDVDFGLKNIGDTIIQKMVVKNEGSSEATISRLEFQGDKGQGCFEILNLTLPFTLMPSETRNVEIRFTTKTGGEFKDSIGVGDDCVFRYRRLIRALTGAPVIDVSDIAFGQVKIGKSLRTTFTVSNRGDLLLFITGATPPTPNDNVFILDKKISDISTSNPLILEPVGMDGDNAVFTITFKPLEKRFYSASITFSSNAVGIDNVLRVTGEGVDIGLNDVESDAVQSIPHIESISPSPANGNGSDIHFRLPATMPLRLDVVNINGIVVATLLNTTMNEGEHTVHYTPADIANGLYLVRMQAGTEFCTKPFVLNR